jgi:hypothetical protein
MAMIFTHAVGMVSRITSDRPVVPLRINFEQGENRNFIITQAGINQSGNFQFLHTLQDMLYIYVFGDRVSEIQVSGIAFAGICGASGDRSGIAEILDFYRFNKISSRPTPVLLRFGDQQHVFQSFLTGCQVEVSRPEINLGQFFLRFHAAPQ